MSQSGTDLDAAASSGSLSEQAQQRVQEAADEARERAFEATDQARTVLRDQVDRRTSEVGIQVGSKIQDLRKVAQELRNQGQEAPANVADQLADHADRFAGYLRTTDADRLLRDVENFARRQPWAVIVGGAGLGFVASRFLKASSSRRYSSQMSGPPRFTSTRSTDELRSELREAEQTRGGPAGLAGNEVATGSGFGGGEFGRGAYGSPSEAVEVAPAWAPEGSVQTPPTEGSSEL